MNKLFRLILLVLLCFSNNIIYAQQDSVGKLPKPHWSRARKIDIKHISLDLKFDWKKRQAYGTAVITLSPLNSTSEIALDAGMLTINSIVANGSVLTFSYDGSDKDDALKIMLNRIYKRGETLTITIDYHTNYINETDAVNLGGSNGRGLRFIWPTPMEPKRKRQIWSFSEPESNRYWFPGCDFPNDFRTTDLKLTIDKDLTAIATGKLIQVKDNADGTQTFQYRSDTPHANQNTSFVIGTYSDIKQSYEEIELHNFSYTDEVEATTASVERLPDMVKFFSEYTGVKYPYATYAQVFVQDLPWGAAGTGFAAQSENMVDDFETHADYLYLWDALEGESLAWQWTGSYVTPSDWSHTWLSKGLSRYLSGLYSSYKNGEDEFLLWQHSFADQAIYHGDWSAGFREPIVSKNYTAIGGNGPYYYGASVMRMLNKQLGDDNWKKSLNQYFRANAGKPVTTEDFRKAIEVATGEPMDWFFDQWVYRVGHPVFEVTKHYNSAKKELTLIVKQTQKLDSTQQYPQAEFFQGKVEVEIDQQVETVWLSDRPENTFTFSLPQEPKLVNFDYQSTWLKELIFDKSISELNHLAIYSTDAIARQAAIRQLAQFAKSETATPNDRTTIVNTLRSIIQSNAYWRIRMGALNQLHSLFVIAGKPTKLDEITLKMLQKIIATEKSWVKATAITFLGSTENPAYASLYIQSLSDKSDRVVNAAATALGKSKSPKAFDALAKLVNRPSWKNQSLISSLTGLQQLKDPRGYDIAYTWLSDLTQPRWNLPELKTGLWDYRVFAAQLIASLGRSSDAYPLIFERLKQSLKEQDLNVIFNNVLLIETLADPKGQEIYPLLREKFKNDKELLGVVDQYETQFKEAIATK